MARERIVAGRFGILGRVGSGGMGAVYRAVDHTTGQLVAVKEIHGLQPEDHDRFARECAFLASLDEPGIVRYVAHGSTDSGSKFLAMEWVDGPTVSDEIKRRGFKLKESVELVTAVARIVSAVHKRGIVHRDIKPSNIVLQAGDYKKPKLLDFGVARLEGSAAADITASGLVVGSAGYLSPEQATGRKDIDARADVFSLGCLLFKCLTGRVPFRGDDAIGVLLKISLEDAPRVRDFVPQIPQALDDLVAKLLARDRSKRPRDASEVARLLAAQSIATDEEPPPSVNEGAITGAEQRLAILVLGRKDQFAAREATNPNVLMEPDRAAIDRAVARLELSAEIYSDGTVVVVLADVEPLPDLARRAVRAALALKAADPSLYLSVTAGRATDGRAIKIGDTVDRGADMLTHLMLHHEPGDIALDGTITSLVEPSYEIEKSMNVAKLISERSESGVRNIHGRRATCTGREREVAFLRGLVDQTVEDGRARCALVVGDTGMGKSRLCHEIVSGLDRFATEVWVARADPFRKDTPFGMLAPLIHELAGIEAADPDEARWKKLVTLVDATAPGPTSYRIVEFLAEIAGITVLKRKPSPTFDAARRDPVAMGESTRRALADFVGGVTAMRPLFIALEDVQWADQATLSFLDATLRTLEDRPVFVMALARPEVANAFPNLFAGRRLQTLHLEPISDPACAKMARELMSDEADEAQIERIVQRAGGNAFFVEELARAALDGTPEALPDAVLAVIESRFDAMPADARRVLRAASVFGRCFWQAGIKALAPRLDVAAHIAELERGGAIVRARRSRLRGQIEFTFRNELLQDAAYARIPEEDRKRGHRAAARWLEEAGERDPIVLAEHYERGGDGQSAVSLLAVAAHLALEASDLPQAIGLCERALACGAFGEERGKIHVTMAEARYWLGRAPEALAHARDALARLAPGDPAWCTAASVAIAAAGRTNNRDALKSIAATVFSLPRGGELAPDRIVLFSHAAIELIFAGKLDVADQALSQVPQGIAQKEPATAAWFYRARAWRAMASGDPCGYGMLMKRSAAAFDQIGDVRNACVQRVNVAYAGMCVGHVEEATVGLESVIDLADGLGLASVLANARLHIGLAKAWLGRFDEAESDEVRALEAYREQRDERMAAISAAYLARILLERHRTDDAEGCVREGLALIEGHLSIRALLLATRSQCLVQRAKLQGVPIPVTAIRCAGDAEALLGEIGGIDPWEGYVRWSLAHVLWEAKDLPEAVRALTEAKSSLEARAAKITVEAQREPFLTRIPEHALTLALHKHLCGG